jgi:hypothetical protein
MSVRSLCSGICLFILSLTVSQLSAQEVEPYPNAITNRSFYPKTPMTPPAASTQFTDPDLGGLMVRVTNENSNLRVPRLLFSLVLCGVLLLNGARG